MGLVSAFAGIAQWLVRQLAMLETPVRFWLPAQNMQTRAYVTVLKGEKTYAICPVGRNKNGTQGR